MAGQLLLVDLENRPKVNFAALDETFRVVIYVGYTQNPPKATIKSAMAYPAAKLEIVRIQGDGNNALDFHIACHLGRVLETAKDTRCHVLSGDAGFDPLLTDLNKKGLWCQRIGSLEQLLPAVPSLAIAVSALAHVEVIVCSRCHKSDTIDHHGGKWCVNCGSFATPSDPAKLPSNQPGFVETTGRGYRDDGIIALCGSCNQTTDVTGGIYDDGEWMCGNCIAGYIE